MGYRRESFYPDEEPSLVVDSTLFTDVHLETRLRTDRFTVRTKLAGGYRHEFLDGGSGETRTNALFVEAEDHVLGLDGWIGPPFAQHSRDPRALRWRSADLRPQRSLHARIRQRIPRRFAHPELDRLRPLLRRREVSTCRRCSRASMDRSTPSARWKETWSTVRPSEPNFDISVRVASRPRFWTTTSISTNSTSPRLSGTGR